MVEKEVGYRINTAHTAAVAPGIHWLKIDENTPRGVGMWLINKASSVSCKGHLTKDEKFFDHWFPNPTFQKAPDKQIDQS